MIYILGQELKDNQKVSIGLTGLFGVGYTYASYLCAKAGISQRCPLSKLSRDMFA